MKKRVSNIKKGIIMCCTLAVVSVTCIAAANAENQPEQRKESYANTATTETIIYYADNSAIADMSPEAIAEQKAKRFEAYKDYGVSYDKKTDNLYYNGELVRSFEDWYSVGDGGSAGIDYFNEKGTIDIHGMRDLSQLIHNADGSYDPSGKLIGVEPYSQEKFAARDIDKIKNPPQAVTSIATNNSVQDNEYPYPYACSNFQLAGETKEAFQVYAEFGLTYDDDDVFRYNGKKVRRFSDEKGTLAFTREVVNDYDKSADLTAIRDSNGKLTGLSVASKEEFDKRTSNIEQSRKEWEGFLKTNPNVTSYASAEADGSYTPTANANNSVTVSNSNSTVMETTVDVTAGSYSDSDYMDYNEYGLYFDPKTSNIYYNGELVRRFYDECTSTVVTRLFNVNGGIDVTAIRNDKYELTGLYKHTQKEFDERTETMLANNTITQTMVDVETASYSNSSYVDTSLNEYIDYGVSYDSASTKWLFDGKAIDFLIDTGHQIYVNFSADNTDSNFAETVRASNNAYLRVTRRSNSKIDKITEMTIEEAVKAINDVFN